MSSMKKVYFPKTRFSEMVARAGGITRGAAVDGALLELENMRAESYAVIEKSVATIEAVAYKPEKRGQVSHGEMRELLCHADQVVTLAGTFGYVSLDKAAKSMCDVIDGMMTADLHDAAPILVHVQALRLMAPGGMNLGEQETQKILSELNKILLHFHFSSLGATPDDDRDLPNVA